jgi:plastocyanin
MTLSLNAPARLALACSAAVLLAACGTASSTASSVASAVTAPLAAASSAASVANGAGAATLTIAGFQFSPLTVPAGANVTVSNTDAVAHTVTISSEGLDVQVPANGTATFAAPSTAGTYDLTCDFHPTMKGTLVVTS